MVSKTSKIGGECVTHDGEKKWTKHFFQIMWMTKTPERIVCMGGTEMNIDINMVW